MQNCSNCKRRHHKCSKQIILEGILDSTQEKETAEEEVPWLWNKRLGSSY
jgi:Zn-finger protein